MATAQKNLINNGIPMLTGFGLRVCSACLSGCQENPFCPSSGRKDCNEKTARTPQLIICKKFYNQRQVNIDIAMT
jgi:hypothetical protein